MEQLITRKEKFKQIISYINTAFCKKGYKTPLLYLADIVHTEEDGGTYICTDESYINYDENYFKTLEEIAVETQSYVKANEDLEWFNLDISLFPSLKLGEEFIDLLVKDLEGEKKKLTLSQGKINIIWTVGDWNMEKWDDITKYINSLDVEFEFHLLWLGSKEMYEEFFETNQSAGVYSTYFWDEENLSTKPYLISESPRLIITNISRQVIVNTGFINLQKINEMKEFIIRNYDVYEQIEYFNIRLDNILYLEGHKQNKHQYIEAEVYASNINGDLESIFYYKK